MEAVIVALIGALGLIITAKINKSEAQKTRTMIQTNHGKQPWEYLEMVAEVKNEVLVLGARVDTYMVADEKAHQEIRDEVRKLAAA